MISRTASSANGDGSLAADVDRPDVVNRVIETPQIADRSKTTVL